MLHSTKLKGVEDMKQPLTSDKEMQSLTFCPTGIQTGLGEVFPHYAYFPYVGNGNIYSMPIMLKVCYLLFQFYFRRYYS